MLGAGVLLATGVVFVVSGLLIDKLGFLPGAIVFGLMRHRADGAALLRGTPLGWEGRS